MSQPFKSSKKSENLEASKSQDGILANNIRNVGKHINQGFQDNLLNHICNDEGYYLQNVDGLSLAYSSKKYIEVDSYYLSSIVSKIESNHPELCKNPTGIYPCNCGQKVMSVKLQNKIFGTTKNENKDSTVDIVKYKKSYSYQGVMVCNNVWGCPVCARKLSERRKQLLSKLLKKHHKEFGNNSMTMTLFTVPHGLGDDLEDILERISKAYRYMTQSNGYKDLTKKFKGCGTVRNLEVTYGTINGFHPHIHCLQFFKKSVENLDELSEKLFELWGKALKKYGFEEPNKQGFGCKIVEILKQSDDGVNVIDDEAVDAIAEYLTKVEDANPDDLIDFQKRHANAVKNKKSSWGVEHELTKWHLKKGSQKNGAYSYTMFDFLRGYELSSMLEDEESRKGFYSLWLKYRQAFKGSRQLFIKHKHFKIKELELDDDELGELKPEDNQAQLVASIKFDIWQLIVMMKARGTVLKMVRKDGIEGLNNVIELLKTGYEALPDDKKILHFHFDDG